ncbi:MAG TPA: AraC family transcriptional regulator [Xanthobacteraceae bacterium]|nr:AraC family transcriptional regulator [Xanthobacteraceae bacterium]
MAADALSDLLRTVRLTGATFFDVVAKEPWVVGSAPRDLILPKVLPDADHLIAYHVVTEGRAFATIVGGEAITVEAGEVVVFTHGDPHIMSSGPGMRPAPTAPDALDAIMSGQMPFRLNCGGDGTPSSKFVCGFLACDARPFNPLLENLPPVIKAGNPQDGDGGWLGQFIRVAVAESAEKRAGGEGVLAKLSELMFIEVVRRHLEALPPEQAGWLAGLRDPFVGRALSLMHGKPGHNWTLEELAKQTGLSRSVLAERFTDLLGIPPMHYLAQWRMQIASELLAGGNGNVARIAAEIGYESEAAFSRAFKKLMGVPPSAWRRRARPESARLASKNPRDPRSLS